MKKKEKDVSRELKKPRIEDFLKTPHDAAIEASIKEVTKQADEEKTAEKQIIAAVKQTVHHEYRPKEFYKKEGQPEEHEKVSDHSSNKEIILEWEHGLRDEDAIYKDPIQKVRDAARDFNNPGKRFLDRRTQKYKPPT